MTNGAGIPTRAFISLILILAIAVVWLGENGRVIAAQEGEQAIFFRVTDPTKQARVTDLTTEDFSVSQGGVECEVVSAELVATRLQLALVLLHKLRKRNMPTSFEADMAV